jgi:hypothetical protein
MAKRERPVVVSTRVTPRERSLIAAIAQAEGISICEVLHRMVMPAVRERITELLAQDFAG